MDLHVCKSCGAVANVEVQGRCRATRNGKHAWLSGYLAENYMQRLWRLKSRATGAGAETRLTSTRS